MTPPATTEEDRERSAGLLIPAFDRCNRWFGAREPCDDRRRLIRLLILASTAMIALPVANQVVAWAGFVAGLTVGAMTLPAAWSLTAVFMLVLTRRSGVDRPGMTAAALIATQTLVLVCGSAGLGRTYDLSFDGQWFNQEAVLLLEDGWNPLRAPVLEDASPEIGARSRVDGYPKAAWLMDAAIFALTGRIETGKGVHLLLLLATALAVTAAALCIPGLSIPRAALIGVVVTVNPVALNQLTTHMVDSELFAGLTVLAAALVIMTIGPDSTRAPLAAGLGLIWATGCKFSGGPMAGALLVSALLIAVLVNRQRVTPRRIVGLVIAAGAAAILNANPFVTNTAWFSHPLYPYYGPQRTDNQFTTADGGLGSMLMSMASQPARRGRLEDSHRVLSSGETLILPFSASLRHFVRIRMPGQHIGGWGPLFGAMLLLAATVLIVEVRARAPAVVSTVMLMVAVAASAAVLQHPWVARYTPQTWWIPLLALPIALTSARWISRTVGWVLAVTAATTGTMVTALHLDLSIDATARTRQQLLGLGADGTPFDVSYRYIRSNRQRLTELGLDANEVFDSDYALEVVMGRKRARLKGHRVVTNRHGEHRLTVRWRPDPVARFHRLRILSPDDPDGLEPRLEADFEQPFSSAKIPLPSGDWVLEVSGCNALGCGPAATVDISVPES